MFPYVLIFGRELSTYALMTGIGAIFAVPMYTVLLQRKHLLNKYFSGSIVSIFGIIFGGKVFAIICVSLTQLIQHRTIDLIDAYNSSGIVYYGGLFGFLFVYWMWCFVKKIPFSAIENEVAVCIPLFHFWGRIGCFFTGCCYGKEYQGQLSILYDNGKSVVQRIPVQLIEAVFELCLFYILYRLYKHNGKRINILRFYLFIYAIFRMFVEFLRGDTKRGIYYNYSFSQYISLIVILTIALNSLRELYMPSWKREGYVDESKAWRNPNDDYIDCNGYWRRCDNDYIDDSG